MPPAIPSQDGPRWDWRRIWSRWRRLGGLLSGISGIVLAVWRHARLVERVLLVVYLLLQLALLACLGRIAVRTYTEISECRSRSKPWTPSGELLVEVTATASLTLLSLAATVGGMLEFGAGGGVAAACCWLVACAATGASDRRHRRPRLALRFFCGTPLGRYLREIERSLDHPAFATIWRTWRSLQQRPQGAVSGLIILVFVMLVSSSAAGIGAALVGNLAAPTEAPPDVRPAPSQDVEPQGTPPVDGPPETPSAAVEPRPVTFAEVCGPPPLVLPGQGAPEWGWQRLFDLYFGPGGGAGAVVAGCPGPTGVSTDGVTAVAYQVGRDRGGGILSVALATSDGVSAMVLGEPARYVSSRLEHGVVVSASPRINIGRGDLQLVHEPAGTTVFFRLEKVSAGQAGSYCALTPQAARAWLGAMSIRRAWLSPRCVGDRIELRTTESRSTVVAEIFQNESGVAVLLTERGEERFSSGRVTLDELKTFKPPRTP